MKGAVKGFPLVGMGLALVLPLLLVVAVLVITEAQVRTVSAAPPGGQTPPTQYAQTYAMSILDAGRTVRVWLENADSAPYFRQTVEANGATVSDQIYRFDERTLYTAEVGADGAVTWTSAAGIEPTDIQLSSLNAGPGAWALQYGPGEQQIPLADGTTLSVTIESVNEPLDPLIFQLPADAVVTPAQP